MPRDRSPQDERCGQLPEKFYEDLPHVVGYVAVHHIAPELGLSIRLDAGD